MTGEKSLCDIHKVLSFFSCQIIDDDVASGRDGAGGGGGGDGSFLAMKGSLS